MGAIRMWAQGTSDNMSTVLAAVSFHKDTRGVAPLIGFIFLFGFLVIGLSLYQATIVPQQNAEIEFNHNERVEGDIITVRDGLHNVGLNSELRSQNIPVTLGAQYPARWIAINPVAPTGTISTADAERTVQLEANGEEKTFETRAIRYEPNYAEYVEAPNTVIEHTLVYNEFDHTDLIVERETLFQSGEITVPIIEGTLSKTSSGTVSVPTVADEKQPATEILGVDDDDEVTITLSTDVPGMWEELAADRQGVSVESEDAQVEITAVAAAAVHIAFVQLDVAAESQGDLVSTQTGPVLFSETVENGISDDGSGEYDTEGSQLSTDLWDEEGNMDAGDVDEELSENTLVYTNQSADVSEFQIEADEGVTVYTENDFETGDEFEINDVEEGDVNIYTGGDFTGEELEIDGVDDGDVLIYTAGDFTFDEVEIDSIAGDLHFYVGGDVSIGEVDIDDIDGDVILYDEQQDYGDLADEADDTRDVDEFPDIEF